MDFKQFQRFIDKAGKINYLERYCLIKKNANTNQVIHKFTVICLTSKF